MRKFNVGNVAVFFLIFLLFFMSQGYAGIGDPVPGAEIFIEQEPADEPMIVISTDADGKFSLEGMEVLKKGTYKLYVVKSSIENLNMNGKKFHIDFKVVLNESNQKVLLFSKKGEFDRDKLLQRELIVSSKKKI